MIDSIKNFFIGESPALYEQRQIDFQKTAMALAIVALFFFSMACICYGTGMLPPATLQGLGLIVSLFGYFVNQVAFGVTVCGLVALAISGVCYGQKLLASRRSIS